MTTDWDIEYQEFQEYWSKVLSGPELADLLADHINVAVAEGRFQIEHHGQVFTCLGRGKSGHPIWPIEEFLTGYNFTPAQEERLKVENPNGFEEGCLYTNIKGLPDDFLDKDGKGPMPQYKEKQT